VDCRVERDAGRTRLEEFLPQHLHVSLVDIVGRQGVKHGCGVGGKRHIIESHGLEIRIGDTAAGDAVLFDDGYEFHAVNVAVFQYGDAAREGESAQIGLSRVAFLPDDDVDGIDVVGEKAILLAPRVGRVVLETESLDFEV
jgi:hypothetical protein